MARERDRHRRLQRDSWTRAVGPILHVLLISSCINLGSCNISGSGGGLMSPILDVMLSLAQSTLNVTWVDDNMGTTDYLVNYTATVNSVVLEEGSVTTTDLDVTLMGEFVQSGVNISVEVQARIEDTACDPVSGSIEISGDFAPTPTSFQALTVSSTSLNLSWTIQFPQVKPDSFSLDYDLNKLSGSPASSSNVNLTLSSLDTNLIISGGNFSYLLEGLTPLTEYSFNLSSVYGTAVSDVVAASTNTAEDALADCGSPPAVSDATVATPGGTLEGSTATYTCDSGFGLASGDATLTCVSGIWTGTPPTCAADCGSPPAVSEATVATPGGTLEGSTATYTCDSGFGLASGDATLTCVSGIWTGTSPTCAADCGSPPAVSDATVATPGGTLEGSTATYTCDGGFGLASGDATLTCVSGIWTGTPPTCAADCGSPPAVSDATVATPGGTLEGSTATYTCDSGFGLASGDATLTCVSGIWTGTPPTCAADCGSPPSVSDATVATPGGTLEGSTATYTCDSGFGLASGDSTLTCVSGIWTGTPPTCSEPGQVDSLDAFFSTVTTGDFNSTTRMYTLDMTIMWNEPSNPNGDITSYEVTVYQTDSSIDIVYTATPLVPNVTQSVMVLPFTNYTVTVAASTSAGQGDKTFFTIQSPEAEPDQVGSLDASFSTVTTDDFNSTTRMYTLDMTITWNEPSNPNGDITSYNVSVYQTDSSGDIVYTATLLVPNVTQSVMVLPFTNYTVTVAASTSAGQGDKTFFTIQSPEAEPDQVGSLDASFSTVTTDNFNTTTRMYTLDMTIIWNEPSNPNGDITSYEVTVYQTDVSSDIVYTKDSLTVPSVTQSVMVLPFTNYTVTVAASTSAGQGDKTSFTIQSPEAEPGQVGNLHASFATTGSFVSSTRMYTLDMTITWNEPTNPNGDITSYKVTVYQTDSSSDIVYTATLSVPNVTQSVMVLPFTNYTVTVAASTSVGQGDKMFFTIQSPEAEPGQVGGLDAFFSTVTTDDFNPTTRMYTLDMTITWNEPSNPNGDITSYEVTVYQTDNSSDIVYTNDSLAVPNVTQSVMVLPFTNYTVTVAAATSAGQGDKTSFTIQSPEAEPGQVGGLDASFSTVTTDDLNSTTRMYTLDMTISWNEPSNPNGDITSYEVTVYQTDNSSDIVYTNDSLAVTSVTESVMVLPFTNYTVTMAASTSAGQGDKTSFTIQSPEAAPSLVEDLQASFDTTGSFNPTTRMYTLDMTIIWNEPSNPNGDITSYEVTVYQTDNSSDIVYTNDSLVVPNVTQSVMVLPFTNYTVTVAASTSAGQGDKTSFTIQSPEAAPGLVEDLQASLDTTGSFNPTTRMYTLDMTIMWNEPSNPNGDITSYEVTVYQTDNSSDIVYTNDSLAVPNVTQSVMVLPFTNYNVTVAASTSAGQGDKTSFTIQSPEAAPGLVEDLQASFDTTGSFNPTTRMYTLDMTITWNEPSNPNGDITSYEVTVYQTDSSSDIVYTNDSLAVPNVTQSVMVLPFTNYNVTVAASTSAGQGDKTSFTIQSPEAAPGLVEDLQASFDTTGSFNPTTRMYTLDMTITWNEPSNPNGDITSYEVTVYQTDNSSDIVYTNDSLAVTSVTQSVMVLPFTNYTVTVAASTSAGQGDKTFFTIQSPEAEPDQVGGLDAFFSTVTTDDFNSTTRMYTLDMTITWNEPSNPNGDITSYEVTVYQTDNSSDIVYTNDSLAVTSVTQSVMILPFTNYTVTVAASTSAGQGDAVRIFETSPQAAPGPVRLLEAEFNTSSGDFNPTTQMYTIILTISFSPPTFLNGLLSNYTINVVDTVTGSTTVYSTTLTDPDKEDDVSIEVTVSVLAYVNYTVRVQVFTGAGGGEISEEIVLSPQAGPSAPNASAVAVNSTAISVMWSQPEYLNGVLQSYTVTVMSSMGELETTVEADALAAVVGGLTPHTEYSVSVEGRTEGGGDGESSDTVSVTTPEAAPTAVIDLTVSYNSTSIAVTWQEPEDPNGNLQYNITITGMDLNREVEVLSVSAVVTELLYSVEVAIQPYAEYTVTVIAETGGGESDEATDSFTTDEGESTVPVDFIVRDITNTSVTFQWLPPSDANGIITNYNITLRANGFDDLSMTVTNSTFEVTFYDLPPFVNHTVVIFATNGFGNGASTTLEFMTSTGIPQAPTLLSVTASDPGTLNVTWAEPTTPNGVIISYTVAANNRAIVRADVTGTEVVLSGLDPYTSYSVSVQACTSEGCGSFSDEITVTTLEEVPSAPRDVTVRALSSRSANVTWAVPDPANGIITDYRVIYYPTSNSSGELATTTGGADTMAVITGLTPFTNYTVYVEGVTIEIGDRSEDVTVVTLMDAPTAPLNLMAVGTAFNVSLQWNKPQPANGIIDNYIIQYYQPSTPTTITLFSSTTTETSVVVDGLSAFTDYTFRVSAVTVEEGDFSEVNVTTEESTPSPPLSVTARNSSSTTIIVEWSTPITPRGIITSYSITYYISQAGSGRASTMVVSNGSATSAEIVSLMKYTEYTVFVQANTSVGIGDMSELVTVVTSEDRPSVPRNFSVDVINSTSITVSWSAPAAANGILLRYNVYLQEEANGQLVIRQMNEVDVIQGVSSYSLSLYNLSSFTLYGIYVSAETRIGEGDMTEVLFVTTDPDSASPPSFVSAEVLNSTAIQLFWGYPEIPRGNITGYIIYHNVTNAASVDQLNSTLSLMNDMSNQTHIFTNLSPFTFYWFRVGAFAVTEEETHLGTPSDLLVDRTHEDLPSMPVNFNLASVTDEPSQLSASWSKPEPANGVITHYTLSCSLSNVQYYPYQLDIEPSSITIVTSGDVTVMDLQPFTNYSCFVTANTSVGEGVPSSTDSERTVESIPSSPRDLALEPVSTDPTQLSASWTPPEPANGIIMKYTLYCSRSDDQPYPEQMADESCSLESCSLESNGDALSTVVMGLTAYTNYDCNITATTGAGEGSMSPTMTRRTNESSPSDSPQNFVAEAVNSTSIQLTWDRPTTPNGVITHYSLMYSTADGPSSDAVIVTEVMYSITYTVDGLKEFTDYTFTVAAVTSVGSGPDEMTTEQTDEDAPSAGVQGLIGVNSSSTSLSISWQPPPIDDRNGVIRAYNISYGLTMQDRSDYVSESRTEMMTELRGLEKFTVYVVVVSAFTVADGPEEMVTVRTDSDLPSEPLNLRYENVTAASIRVFWEPPAERNGILLNYNLMYIEVATGREVELSDIAPGNESDGYLVGELMEYDVYAVRVAASTDKGFGNYSSSLEVLTDEHEPDAPENFTVTSSGSTSVHASWDEPLDSNGVIISFSLTVSLSPNQEYLPDPDTPRYTGLDPNLVKLDIGQLHPFANYFFTLTAATSFGPGNLTDASEMTNEAAPSQSVQDVSALVISPKEVKVMWIPPELQNWNGILTNYTVGIRAVLDCQQLKELEDFPGSPRSELLVPAQFQTLPNPTEAYLSGGIQLESLTVDKLEEYQSYVFVVRVSNSQEGGPESNTTVCNRTQEAAPTGSPGNLSFLITSNTTAELSWQHPLPLEQNGVIVDYSIQLYDNRTGEYCYRNMGSNETFYEFEGLTPFTSYSVSVAALTSQGQGPNSTRETNMTLEGLPTMPSSLTVDDYDHNYIALSWQPPEIPYGNVDLYRIRYQGFKDLEDEVACSITDGMIVTTSSLGVNLTGLTGDSQYCIEVSARTGAGYGNISGTLVDLPNGPPPAGIIDPVQDPQVVPQPVEDPATGDDGITDTSATVMFTLPAEIEMNGPVDNVLFYVQRMPSSNSTKGTWFESNRASLNWPQYAAVYVKVASQQRSRREAGNLAIMATIGDNTVQCGPQDIVCNGPLVSDAQYGVRYALFSGNQSQEYPFFEEAQFTTDMSPTDAPTSSVGPVVGGVVGALLATVLIAAVVLTVYCLVSDRRKGSIDLTSRMSINNHDKLLLPRKNGSTHKPATFLGPSDPGIVPLGEIKNAGYVNPRSSSMRSNTRRMMLKDLGGAVRGMLDDAGYIFAEEYERVTEVGLEHSKEASLMTENRAKNRYTNILAYDHSRVKLSYVDDDPGSDYINASYIPGYRMRRAYIATQGPLPATFDDFWRMVWEQNSHTIVMLTQLVERGRTKCHRYWPGAEVIVYGEIAVEMISEKEKDDWTVREFKLSMEKKSRTVWHYQFTSWPDHGVPETPTPALDFVRIARDSVLMNHGPLVVHCSAGVGRTGCFIALDTLLQHIEEHDFIDIFGLVSEMRQHRNHMIQTEAQYVFVHKAMVEYVETHYSSKSPSRFSAFPSLYTNHFAEDSTQMTDYYGDFLSEETHM